MTASTTTISVDITDSSLAAAAAPLAAQLVEDKVASKVTAQDPTLWGAEAEQEAAIRLGWTTLHVTSRQLIGEITDLHTELQAEGIDRVVLAGMGGSSLAPEVIAATEPVTLTVLDTTDPGQVADALAGDLTRTVLVVSSKSGGTAETESQRRIFATAFAEEGIDPASRMVVVTDPGSPLAELANQEGYRKVFLADPTVGGRYSALTAFGLVPAGLAGADVARLLDQAAAAADQLSDDSVANPAIQLAAAFGAAHEAGAEKIVLTDTGSGIVGLSAWIEQLVAESTGKQGIGLLPVVVESGETPGFVNAGDDATTVSIGAIADQPGVAAVVTEGSLGGQFLLWEYASAIVGRLLGINPFDQPDVEAAKRAARTLLDGSTGATIAPSAVLDSIEVYASSGVSGEGSLTDVLRQFVATVPENGYLAVQAYLDRQDDASASLLRAELAKRIGAQVTFGWGPRFLHSTGQYHKGGHPNGVFLQLTGDVEEDLDVPGLPYRLSTLQLAQARGDAEVLTDRGRPVVRLHLTDRLAGLAELVRAVQDL
ncbi:MAG: glucose-6-phosphate isomerase [Actinophytocola sp.]|nr:glucose-6-phosphate isomerase [Actinophytocola sp.]